MPLQGLPGSLYTMSQEKAPLCCSFTIISAFVRDTLYYASNESLGCDLYLYNRQRAWGIGWGWGHVQHICGILVRGRVDNLDQIVEFDDADIAIRLDRLIFIRSFHPI